MDESFTLSTLSERTGIPVPRFRYVVDQGVLPVQFRQESGSHGRGTPRTFTPLEAFAIACAALMIEAGLRRLAGRLLRR